MTQSSDDQDVDRLLAALSVAAPAPGMERRILHTLHSQPPAPPARRWFVPVLATAMATGLLTFAYLTPHSKKAAPETVARAAAPTTVVLTPHPSGRKPLQPVDVPTQTGQPTASLTDMRIVSPAEINQPASPMPLTDQERLLVRLARRARPQDFVALSSEVAELQQARDLAAFDAFFQQILLPAFNPSTEQSAPDQPEPDAAPTQNPGDDSWQPATRN